MAALVPVAAGTDAAADGCDTAAWICPPPPWWVPAGAVSASEGLDGASSSRDQRGLSLCNSGSYFIFLTRKERGILPACFDLSSY